MWGHALQDSHQNMELLLGLCYVSPLTGVQVWCQWDPQVLHNEYIEKPNRVLICQFFVQVEQLNSYLYTLLCLYYSPKANQATKKSLPLDDANLTTHLWCMGPAKWQTQYDFIKNTTPISTRALLLVLEDIPNNAKLNQKCPRVIKAKGAGGKHKMESINSCISKKPRKVGWSNKHCVLCKKHGGPHKSHSMRECHCFNKDSMWSTRVRAQPGPSPKKRDNMVQTLHRSCNQRLRKNLYHSQEVA